MRIAYFDPFSGAAGDMILGALVDVGFPEEELRSTVAALGQPALSIQVEPVRRGGIAGRQVQVRIDPPEGHPHRGLSDVLALIQGADLPESVQDLAGRIFQRLARAEAEVHGTDVDRVHFHEVGALDALADIVGAAAGILWLQADRIVVAPPAVGFGTVKCAHGVLPVPAPATLRLLEGVPTRTSSIEGELLTPTGAAILVTVADEFGPWPSLRPERQGFGAGTKEHKGHPNLLRLVVGTGTDSRGSGWERVDHLATTIDDMLPEHFDPLQRVLAAAGALDSWLTPVQMKKGRPGVLLQVLSPPERTEELVQTLVTHSTTLGVRVRSESRFCLPREIRTVETRYGPVRLKVARLADGSERGIPEHEDCLGLATRAGVPIMEVYRAALTAD